MAALGGIFCLKAPVATLGLHACLGSSHRPGRQGPVPCCLRLHEPLLASARTRARTRDLSRTSGMFSPLLPGPSSRKGPTCLLPGTISLEYKATAISPQAEGFNSEDLLSEPQLRRPSWRQEGHETAAPLERERGAQQLQGEEQSSGAGTGAGACAGPRRAAGPKKAPERTRAALERGARRAAAAPAAGAGAGAGAGATVGARGGPEAGAVLEERGAEFRISGSFYRQESALGRDLGLLAAALQRRDAGQLRVMDAMCGSGVRGVRYLLHAGADAVWCNDACVDFHAALLENLSAAADGRRLSPAAAGGPPPPPAPAPAPPGVGRVAAGGRGLSATEGLSGSSDSPEFLASLKSGEGSTAELSLPAPAQEAHTRTPPESLEAASGAELVATTPIATSASADESSADRAFADEADFDSSPEQHSPSRGGGGHPGPPESDEGMLYGGYGDARWRDRREGKSGVEGSRWRITHEDANKILFRCYQVKDYYDLIDIDSFGSESVFIGSAMMAVRRGGLLYVTCTDGFSSGGHAPNRSLGAYGAYVRPLPFGNELGLRMLIGGAVREGLTRGLRVEPLFSHYSFHGPVFRAMLRIVPSGQWQIKNYEFVAYCHLCGNPKVVGWDDLGSVGCHCPKNDGQLRPMVVVGPVWTGPLHSGPFVKRMADLAHAWGWTEPVRAAAAAGGDGRGAKVWVKKKSKGGQKHTLGELLGIMQEESNPHLPPWYLGLDNISKLGQVATPSRLKLIKALRESGYHASRSHVEASAVKTNASVSAIIEAARRLDPRLRSEPSGAPPGTAPDAPGPAAGVGGAGGAAAMEAVVPPPPAAAAAEAVLAAAAAATEAVLAAAAAITIVPAAAAAAAEAVERAGAPGAVAAAASAAAAAAPEAIPAAAAAAAAAEAVAPAGVPGEAVLAAEETGSATLEGVAPPEAAAAGAPGALVAPPAAAAELEAQAPAAAAGAATSEAIPAAAASHGA